MAPTSTIFVGDSGACGGAAAPALSGLRDGSTRTVTLLPSLFTLALAPASAAPVSPRGRVVCISSGMKAEEDEGTSGKKVKEEDEGVSGEEAALLCGVASLKSRRRTVTLRRQDTHHRLGDPETWRESARQSWRLQRDPAL